MRIVSDLDNTVVVDTEDGFPNSTFRYEPLNLEGLTAQDAFVLGMAYSLIRNRGIAPPPSPETPPQNLEEQTEII